MITTLFSDVVSFRHWLFQGPTASLYVHNQEAIVKKGALALVLVVAGLSLGGCFVGKGKAPAPIVTKG